MKKDIFFKIMFFTMIILSLLIGIFIGSIVPKYNDKNLVQLQQTRFTIQKQYESSILNMKFAVITDSTTKHEYLLCVTPGYNVSMTPICDSHIKGKK